MISGIAISLIVMLVIIIVACLSILNFFSNSSNEENYSAYDSRYSDNYLSIVNKNIKENSGYVPLSRILYFYLENDKLSFEDLYRDNLDSSTKQSKLLSHVCMMGKYKQMAICTSNEFSSDQLIDSGFTPFSKPIDFSKVTITSFFMQQREVYGKTDVHEAWDFAAANQTPVYSVCDGIVDEVVYKYIYNTIDKNGGTGNHIKIRCDEGNETYYVLYGHLYPKSSKVKKGDNVSQGKQIATVGNTGYSTGPHLHFEVHKENMKKIDGMQLIDFNIKE